MLLAKWDGCVQKWTRSTLIHVLDRMLSETEEGARIGQGRWLSQWRDQ